MKGDVVKQIMLALVSGLVLSSSAVMAAEKASDAGFDPLEEMQKMQKEIDSIFESFHQKMMKEDMFSKFTFSLPTTPAMDLVDKGDNYVLQADIPGAEENKINITIEDYVLKIEAETSKDKKEEGKGYLKQERFASSYMRMITLPEDANTKNFESDYKDGVLKITIPKKKK